MKKGKKDTSGKYDPAFWSSGHAQNQLKCIYIVIQIV